MLLFSLVLAFLPSLIWLSLFLREDVHPEPNRMVIRVFLTGMLITIPTIVIESILNCFIRGCEIPRLPNQTVPLFSTPFLALPETARNLIYLFIGIAFIEELFKYLAVRHVVLRDRNFDEPIDALLYLVIAALGFAAVENALTVSNETVQTAGFFGFGGVLAVLGARSLSATLLHTLTSGIVGFGLARSFFSRHPRHRIVGISLLLATAIHGAYNGLIGEIFLKGKPETIILAAALLLATTGGMLLLMLKNLRALSIAHRWKNVGTRAEEIA